MNSRIPVMYDRPMRPEWIDYALEQAVKVTDKDELDRVIKLHISGEITEPTSLRKIVRQLQRCVGYLSPLTRERLLAAYDAMKQLAPEERRDIRFELLVNSTPFVADVVSALVKLRSLGIDGVGVSQLYERLIGKYGDRGTIPRRVRYVLRTLLNLGVVEHRGHKWYLTN